MRKFYILIACFLAILIILKFGLGRNTAINENQTEVTFGEKEGDLTTSLSETHDYDLPFRIKLMMRNVSKSRLLKAIESGDPNIWAPALADLKNPYVDREGAIKFLESLLNSEDWKVRAAASRHLFELGSRQGGEVLIFMLENSQESLNRGLDILSMVSTLHRYRFDFDGDLVFGLYEEYGDARMLMYAQLMGSESAREATHERLLKNGAFQNSAMLAGMMRLSDPDSMRVYEQLYKSSKPNVSAEGAWALYMITQEGEYLAHLIDIIEQSVDLRPRSGKQDMGAVWLSLQALEQTITPQAANALKRIEEAALASKKFEIAQRALLGLFYLHKDYEYIDARITSEFEKVIQGGATSEYVWQMASVRRTPVIMDLAKRANMEAYERTFLLTGRRPVEGWVFQYISDKIPNSVRPPLDG